MKKAIRYGRTDGQTDGRTYPNYRKASVLKKIKVMCDRVRTLRFFQKDNMQIKSSNEDHIITSSMAEQIHKDIKQELFK